MTYIYRCSGTEILVAFSSEQQIISRKQMPRCLFIGESCRLYSRAQSTIFFKIINLKIVRVGHRCIFPVDSRLYSGKLF